MNVCVFCGSGKGTHDAYARIIRELGVYLASHHHVLIYGGGSVGLMGVLADSVLASGGHVTGIIPHFLVAQEVGHKGLTSLEVVSSMHERKARMAQMADFFVAAPGGLGTLDELAEILTWNQLSLIRKPVGILNINNYFDSLLSQLDTMVGEGFLASEHLHCFHVFRSLNELANVIDR